MYDIVSSFEAMYHANGGTNIVVRTVPQHCQMRDVNCRSSLEFYSIRESSSAPKAVSGQVAVGLCWCKVLLQSQDDDVLLIR